TRAKKYLYLSRSETSRDKYVSTFLLEAKDSSYLVKYDREIPYNADNIPSVKHESIPISLNFSLLEDYFDCPYRFKLSKFYGFAQPLVPALGYGNVLHEIVRNIHKTAIAGEVIDKEDIKRMIDESFYLPYATKKLAENMYKSVTKAVNHYVEQNRQEFANIQMAETDIEIDMGDGIKVNGRIDLIKKKNEDGVDRTYIVDFKTTNKEVQESINKEQLKIYALGYQELTGTKADYMEVYQLDSENRARESITDNMIEEVRTEIKDAAANIRRNHLPRKCARENCSKCHFNYLCLSKVEKKDFAIG
ncbi:MAG: PD-(D/E)XK nuclease family protein, partial [Ruminococcus flavefaciens]|nr:PD-(D/E)XK nuclease family protein [Ruminococcus flavefaciens]